MAEQDAMKGDARGLQGQTKNEPILPAMDKDNETESPPSSQATKIQGSEPAVGENTEAKGDIYLNANTLEDQFHNVSKDSQVCAEVM